MEQYIYIYIFHYLENTDIANYANDNTLSSPEKNKEIVINATETSLVPFNWFGDNFMKANSNKSHFLTRCKESTNVNNDGSMIKSSQKETLLGINFDSELKFEDHVSFRCKKAEQKLC